MAQIREIKKRMTAVGTIARITKTMQMIATAKFTAAMQRAKATKPFAKQLQTVVSEIAAAAGDIDHPLVRGPSEPTKRELVLVVSSDRGLCGAYNGHVLRLGTKHVRALREQGIDFDLEISGKKAIGYFKFQKIDTKEQHIVGDKPTYEDIERIAQRYIDLFAEGTYDAIRIVYMRYVSNARQIPTVAQLLPIEPVAEEEGTEQGAHANYEFSPSREELLSSLLPLAVKSLLFQAFNDSIVSEQIMRMIAMKAATENAKDLGKMLSRDFNRARQAQITTELSEIIAGSAALE